MKKVALIILTFLFYTTIIFAQNKSSEEYEADENGNYAMVEEMPRFPGCEEMEGTAQEKKRCADEKLLRFIYSNVKYPTEAYLKSKEGMAVVSFTITIEGKVKDIEILRDPGYGMGEETVRVVTLLTNMEERWTPGKQRGKAVPVKYNLPLNFKLS